MLVAWPVRGPTAEAGETLDVRTVTADGLFETLDPFYKQHTVVEGLLITSSEKVSRFALSETAYLVQKLLAKRPEVLAKLVEKKQYVTVMAYNEMQTDLPECRKLSPWYDKRARGLGGRPISCGEENLLCFKGDPYRGESILIHEFAHGIHGVLAGLDKEFNTRLKALFEESKVTGRFRGYGMGSFGEFWAEAVQSWFECNRGGGLAVQGAEAKRWTEIGTPRQLLEHMPRMAKLNDESFGSNPWVYVPVSERLDESHLRGYDSEEAPAFRWPPEVIETSNRIEAERSAKRKEKMKNKTVKRGKGSGPRRLLEPFSLGDVVLNRDEEGRYTPFMKNRDKFVFTLARTDPDRFLYMFRDAFGREQPEGVKPLGGWDSQKTKLRGHATGHYLLAIAQAYAGTTYDEVLRTNFLQKMNYLIETLHDLSRESGKPTREGGPFNEEPTAVPPGPGRTDYDSNLTAEGIRTDYWNWGRGFISAYPPDQFIMLEKGATYGGKDNQVWAPYYTLHKILAGLLDCYEVGGNEKALVVARDMALWVYARLKVVPAATRTKMWNLYIAGEYGGMNEVLARLFRLTEDRRFLDCAVLFDNTDFFFGDAEDGHGLAGNVDTLGGKHANQHIPQITGALETYAATRDDRYYRVARNFFDICTQGYMYSIGGVAGARKPKNSECFTAEANTLFTNGFNPHGQNETCATYNLLKLSRKLFMFEPDGKYMDYYERALYNHILASVAKDNPGNTYHVPLNPGAKKGFGNAGMNGFSCCNGTALESNTKLQDSIYFRSVCGRALYVNLFVPSTLAWEERDVEVKQETAFPYSDRTRLTVSGKGTFEIMLRVPGWAEHGFIVKVNGEEQKKDAAPGTYICLCRMWKDGDTIEVRMPFAFRLERLTDQPNIASIFYGPVLLAVEETEALEVWREVGLNAANLDKSITGDPKSLRFELGDVRLKPFHETHGRHSVYLSVTQE